jgi:hypothetical protein
MTIAEFETAGSEKFEGALLALWWEGRGNWERAHKVATEVAGANGAWVHAYLHRKEGDVGNAAYWYGQAGRKMGSGDLRAEWESIVAELLKAEHH